MARTAMAVAAVSVSLLALTSGAQGRQAASSSFRRCTTGAHKTSYKGSHCPKHKAKKHRRHHSHALFFKVVNGRCPDATLSPSPTNVAQVRAATLCLVNRERARHGERALYWNNKLLHAAQAHTESMAFGDYFAHIGSNGSTPLARMKRAGYIYSSRLGFEVGENIGWGSLWLGTPRAVVAAWMESPGHRANILDRHFRDTGVGVSPHLGGLSKGQPGGLYTQDFGVIDGG